jgi:hypothetical protein
MLRSTAYVQTRNCAFCGVQIKQSEQDLIWRATTYADLAGFCESSPTEQHLPRRKP